MGGSKPYVLAAIPRPAVVVLERALGSYVELAPRHTFAEAVQCLRHEEAVAAVVCGTYFDELRMLDLLRWARNASPTLPFICCRLLSRDQPHIPIESLKIATESLGAPFIDLPGLEREYGSQGADSQLRAQVLSALRRTA